jgi:polyketide cyclase/dehydrase/lipid transport protein
MARGAAHAEIAAPPDEVFPWLVEGERLVRWVGGLLEHEQLTPIRMRQVLAPPLPGTGTVEVRLDVYLLQVPWRVEARMTGPGGLAADIAYVLEELPDDATRVTGLVRSRVRPSATGLLGPVVVAAVRRRLRAELVRLKELVERETSAPARTLRGRSEGSAYS